MCKSVVILVKTTAYLNEKRNWAPDAWKKLKIKPGVKVRVSSRDHEVRSF